MEGNLTQFSSHESADAYFVTTWLFLALALLFYSVLVMGAYPYSRNRTPLLFFVFLIFIPPFFFFFLIYLLLIYTFEYICVDGREKDNTQRRHLRHFPRVSLSLSTSAEGRDGYRKGIPLSRCSCP